MKKRNECYIKNQQKIITISIIFIKQNLLKIQTQYLELQNFQLNFVNQYYNSKLLIKMNLLWFQNQLKKNGIKLRTNCTPQLIYTAIYQHGFNSQRSLQIITESTAKLYQKRLKELLQKLNNQAVLQFQPFNQQLYTLIVEKGWLFEQSVLSLAYHIQKGQLEDIIEILKHFGMYERYQIQTLQLLQRLSLINSNLFNLSIKNQISHFLRQKIHQEHEQKTQISSSEILLNLFDFARQCSRNKIYIKQNYIEQLYQAVYRIGINFSQVQKIAIESTCLPFYKNLNTVLHKIESLNLPINILLTLFSVYLFLQVDYLIYPDMLFQMIDSFFTQKDKQLYLEHAQNCQLNMDYQNYQTINTVLSQLTLLTNFPSIKTIIKDFINQYNQAIYQIYQFKQTFTSQAQKINFINLLFLGSKVSTEVEKDIFEQNQLSKIANITAILRIQQSDHQKTKLKQIIEYYLSYCQEKKCFSQIYGQFNKKNKLSMFLTRVTKREPPSNPVSMIFIEDDLPSLNQMLSNDQRQSSIYLSDKKIISCIFSNEQESQGSSCKLIKQQSQVQNFKKSETVIFDPPKQSVIFPRQSNASQQLKQPQFTYTLIIIIPQKNCQGVELMPVNQQIPTINPWIYKRNLMDQEFWYGFANIRSQHQENYQIKLKYKNEVRVLKAKTNKLILCSLLFLNEKINNTILKEFAILNAVRFISQMMVNNKAQNGFVIQYALNWLQILASNSNIQACSQQNKKTIFENINLRSPHRYYNTLNFTHLLWLIFQDKTYQVIRQYKLLDKMKFYIPPSKYDSNILTYSGQAEHLYLRLYLKQILKSIKTAQSRVLEQILIRNLKFQPNVLTPKKLDLVAQHRPQVLVKLNKFIVAHIIQSPSYDSYDLLIIKAHYLSAQMENQTNTQIVGAKILQFIKQLHQKAIKSDKKRPKSEIESISKIICNNLSKIFLKEQFFSFSKYPRYNKEYLIILYTQCKLLSVAAQELSIILISFIAPYLILKDNPYDMRDLVLVLAMKPVNLKTEKQKLRNIFFYEEINILHLQQIINVLLDEKSIETYDVLQLQTLLTQFIMKNKYFNGPMIQLLALFLDFRLINARQNQYQFKIINHIFQALTYKISKLAQSEIRNKNQLKMCFRIAFAIKDNNFKMLLLKEIIKRMNEILRRKKMEQFVNTIDISKENKQTIRAILDEIQQNQASF